MIESSLNFKDSTQRIHFNFGKCPIYPQISQLSIGLPCIS